MDIATEEFSHLEIVGATITMLLNGISGELKDAAEQEDITRLAERASTRETMIHNMMTDPQFFVLSGGGPTVADSNGNPWQGTFVNANGDLTVDLRSDMAAESRAKIVYEYLIKFTDDPYVKETLTFLMTREVSHMQMFGAALETIQPNFPPGVKQADPRYSHLYFNMSNGASARGPWNEGQGPWPEGENWVYIREPKVHVIATEGLVEQEVEGTQTTPEEAEQVSAQLGKLRSGEVLAAMPDGENQWSSYPQTELA